MRAVLAAGLSALFAVACRPPAPATAPPPDPFPRGYDARSYDLTLSLAAADGAFEGTVVVEIVASRRAGLGDVDLDARGLEIEAVTEHGAPRPFRSEADHLHVTLDRPARAGATRALAIRYRGRPSKEGLAWLGDHASTVFNTPRWMPCNLDPGDRATFRVALAAPPGWQVLAAGTPRGDRWVLDAPHPAYLFGFVTGTLARTARPAAGGVPALEVLSTAHTPPAIVARLLDETPAMIRFLEERSGVPFPGARYAAAFVGGGAKQEVAGFSLLGDDYAADWAATPTEDWLAVHELAHQWWGNAATCPTWGDFWIQEAFAVFMTAAWKERRWGRAAYDRERQLLTGRYEQFRAGGGVDQPLALGADARPGLLARKLVYSKGPLVLFALREELGDARFWAAVRVFTIEAVRASASRTADLQRTFERAAAHPLSIFARAVYAPGAP